MNAFVSWLSSPDGLAIWGGLAIASLALLRVMIGPEIWGVFVRAAREDLAFYRAVLSPWIWPRRIRAWRDRREAPSDGGSP